ncbi:MAG TPA: T9SS type A sorting domain-containing protein [Saprospiraceae bacterium]|nr:T9SS type A sorting domain-containing protein [Saprospiraceae bacterium]
MKNLILTLLVLIISVTVSNTVYCSTSGQPENEALATELKSFTIRLINLTSIISWSTVNPMNNEYFTIERSIDGKTFTSIGKVKATGASGYTFIDYKPNTSINYYRFKKVDFDGTVAVSPVRVSITDKTSPFKISPTIVSDSLSIQNIDTSELEAGSKVQMVLTATGEVMFETKVEANSIKLDIALSTLPAGNYVAKIQKGNKVYNHKFVKQ